MSRQTKRTIKSIVVHLLAVVVTLLMLSPLTWVVSTSLRPLEDVIVVPPQILPRVWTLSPYVEMWQRAPFLRYTLNSITVAVSTACIALLLSVLAAYAFVRFRFWGARALLMFVLVSQAIPGTSILLPLFRVIWSLGLIDTLVGLVIVYTGFAIPFCTWLLTGYFKSIPAELEDAARIDGCSALRVLYTVVVPLSAPAIVAVWVFAFLVGWNEFLFAFIFTKENAPTIPVGMTISFFTQYQSFWNQVSAASIVFSTPPVLLFILLQRQFVRGLTTGAVKG